MILRSMCPMGFEPATSTICSKNVASSVLTIPPREVVTFELEIEVYSFCHNFDNIEDTATYEIPLESLENGGHTDLYS